MSKRLQELVLSIAGNRRLLQDTPIQGDVWLAFAEPARPVDLLLVPARDTTAGIAAMHLRKRAGAGSSIIIAQLPGVVAVRMNFHDFLNVVIPLTAWWQDCHRKPVSKSCAATRSWLEEVAVELGENLPPNDGIGAFIGRVGVNRKFTPAATQSSRTVKADAARQLFGITCKDVTWAVLDTGINAAHPAFRDRVCGGSRIVATYDFVGLIDRLNALTIGADASPIGAAMLERLRTNLAAEASAKGDPTDAATLGRLVKVRLKRMRERLEAGRDLDWTLFEPFLAISDAAAHPPGTDHGTQVAGIIGGDWVVEDGAPDGVAMIGMCPDIKIIDLRVIADSDDDGKSTEFDVIAALQFLRFLNDRSEARKFAVHGANLSLATPHDVRMYGCGATLVCQECDRLSASGVVIVACAGNGGHVGTSDGAGGQYQAISITDPGNAASVITVGATHAVEPHRYGVSWFSSRGPTADGRAKPDLVAPGERIVAPRCDPGSAQEDTGTSFAAPHVSGAAALLIARNMELAGQAARIKAILCATATDLGRDRHFQGAGLLDTLRALQSI